MDKKKFETPSLTVDELSEELVIAKLSLEQANKQLLAEQQARSEMFASISHDLRSPITAIKNAVELLSSMEEYPPEKIQPLLHLMDARIRSLEQMINDIFFLVSLENNCLKMKPEPLPLGFFLEDYFFTQEADNRYKERKLELLVPQDFEATVFVDAHALTRVLDNLFTNALKYSKDGASIRLGAWKTEKQVTIFIEDTGIGIAKEHLEKIFDRCFIVEKARTPGISSTGFGLSITKAIIEYFSGTITCSSKLGVGSRFSFTLPLFQEDN